MLHLSQLCSLPFLYVVNIIYGEVGVMRIAQVVRSRHHMET